MILLGPGLSVDWQIQTCLSQGSEAFVENYFPWVKMATSRLVSLPPRLRHLFLLRQLWYAHL